MTRRAARWVVAALVTLVSGPAAGAPSEVEIYAEAQAVFESRDPARAEGCVAQLLGLLEDPKYPQAVHALTYAAGCAEIAGDLGRSITLRRRVVAEFPREPAARLALEGLAYQLMAIARYAEAADAMETHAARYPAEPRTESLLWDAALLRHGLGQDDRARAALERLEMLLARRAPQRAAEAFWTLRLLEPPDDASRERHAEAFLKRHGRAARPEHRLLALFTLGEIAWRRSCVRGRHAGPEGGWLGICVSLRPGETSGTCGPAMRWQVHARDARLAAQAQAFFREVAREAGALPATERRSPEVREAASQAGLMLLDPELEDYLRLLPPARVDFGDSKRSRADQVRLSGFLRDKQRQGEWLALRLAELARSDFGVEIAVGARVAAIHLHLADSLQGVDTRPPADPAVRGVYCAALRESIAGFEAAGLSTLSACLVRGSVRGEFTGAARFCEAELQRRQPLAFPPLRELFAAGQVLDPEPVSIGVQRSAEGHDEAEATEVARGGGLK